MVTLQGSFFKADVNSVTKEIYQSMELTTRKRGSTNLETKEVGA